MRTLEEKIAAWMEGKLAGRELAEFERELDSLDPAAIPDQSSADLQLGGLLRTHCSSPKLQNADFFNHQLMQRIEADQAAAVSKEAARRRGRLLFFSLPRMAWAGAFCLAMAMALYAATVPSSRRSNPTPSQYISEILNARTEDPAITASTFHSKTENITVLWLDGLNYLPDGEKL